MKLFQIFLFLFQISMMVRTGDIMYYFGVFQEQKNHWQILSKHVMTKQNT